jgi:SAM-dependent methyltransferase
LAAEANVADEDVIEEHVKRDWIFDIPRAKDFAIARKTFLTAFLRDSRPSLELSSAIDVGCGVGEFSKFLSDMNLRVVGVDGRTENAAEAKRRFPQIPFITADAENLPVPDIGTFDLVLCFGLLYHLENPFRMIRSLYSLTSKVLIAETMCTPDSNPTMDLLDEGVSENQSLNYVAFYPSEPCVIKMLYRAGFPFVYRLKRLPMDELFGKTVWRKRLRTIVVASKTSLPVPNLILVKEPMRPISDLGPWATPLSRLRDPLRPIGVRIAGFLGKPWREKSEVLSRHLRRFWRRISRDHASILG